MNMTLTFEDAAATRLENSGGKGANLALLTQRGFPVPSGFIVSSRAYRVFIGKAAGLADAVRALPYGDPGALRDAADKLKASLASLPLPDGLAGEVQDRLRSFPDGAAFSVRSSSTMEDLASAAFAGQHDTFLNCVGSDAVLDKIKACFLSLWGDRAIAYRHRQGFGHLDACMAVVVQRMVFCRAAGVGFSVNPVSGALDEVVLDANLGLGESVVSGEGEVDHYLVDKATLAVREARIGRKTRMVVARPGGTAEESVQDARAGAPCLSDDDVRRLSELVVRVEKSYGFPQDVEWGLADGALHLLQARPITSIPPRWTRDESAERFPGVITPLAWEFVEGGFHRSLNFSLKLMGLPPFSGKWFGMHGHYIYGNQNAVELYARRAPMAFRSLEELRRALPRIRQAFQWVQELPVTWARDLDRYLLRIGEFNAEPLGSKDLAGVWRFVLAVNELGADYFQPNIAISLTQGVLHRGLHHLLTVALGEADARRLFDDLTAFCETKTGAINKELFELALMVRGRPELEAGLTAKDSRKFVESGGPAKHPEFKARLERFLADHGHREVEFDPYHPTWLEAPWVVLDNVRLILQTSMTPAPAQKERGLKIRMQAADVELANRLPEDLRFFAAEVVRLVRAYTSLDDLEHYQTTRLTLPLRRGLRELGNRLAERGAVSAPMDVFFSRWKALDEAVASDSASGWRKLSEEIEKEKLAYLENKARTPEWVLGQASAPEPAGADALSGIPGSPGTAEGPVFLVLTSDDFGRFPKGAVLVARTTNPTWTPLFYSASALVTESGGPLSHGAVTAREMQIPAVMSVRDCLRKLKNGQRVAVDGASGRVRLL